MIPNIQVIPVSVDSLTKMTSIFLSFCKYLSIVEPLIRMITMTNIAKFETITTHSRNQECINYIFLFVYVTYCVPVTNIVVDMCWKNDINSYTYRWNRKRIYIIKAAFPQMWWQMIWFVFYGKHGTYVLYRYSSTWWPSSKKNETIYRLLCMPLNPLPIVWNYQRCKQPVQ